MRVNGFQIEIFSLADGQTRKISVHHVTRRRNWARKFTEVLEQVSRTFDGFVAVTVVPMIQEDELPKEASNGQGLDAAPAVGADITGGQELAADLQEQLDKQPTIEIRAAPDGASEVREVLGLQYNLPGVPT